MNLGLLVVVILVLALAGWIAGRQRAVASVKGDIRKLHSLPGYYGHIVFLATAVPSLLVVMLWLLIQPALIEGRVSAMITPADIPEGSSQSLVMADVRRIAEGLDAVVAAGLPESDLAAMRADFSDVKGRLASVGVALGGNVSNAVFLAAKEYRAGIAAGLMGMTLAALAVAIAGLGWSLTRINPEFRARNATERFTMLLLIASSLIAVLTTVGIVASLLVESIHFFSIYPATKFFFSTVWNPKFGGGSDLGYPRTVQHADGKCVTVYYFNDGKRNERFIAYTIWTPPAK